MKIIAVFGSARKNGNSAKMAEELLSRFDSTDNEIKRYYTSQMTIKPCLGCFSCRKKDRCVHKNDDMALLFEEIITSDLVVFSSPMYCFDVSGSFKMMYDRLYPMLIGNPGQYVPRYPKLKSVFIYSQGAPAMLFREASKIMKTRLKENGFDNLAFIKVTLTGDVSAATSNALVLKAVELYRKYQEKQNCKKIDKVVKYFQNHEKESY